MKNLNTKLFLCLGMVLGHALFSQVTIEIPYKEGDTHVKAKINYGSIRTADSVRLECDFGYDFVRVCAVKGFPKEIDHKPSMKHRFEGHRKYRVVVFQKGKDPINSNEVFMDYKPEFKYSEQGLPAVTGIKGQVVEKSDGLRYVRLTWSAVPKAFAYKIYVKSPLGEMVWDVSVGDVGYVFDTTYDYFVASKEAITFTYAIGAVEGPSDTHDVKHLSEPYTINIPSSYK